MRLLIVLAVLAAVLAFAVPAVAAPTSYVLLDPGGGTCICVNGCQSPPVCS